jgi:hypothetical protein
MTVIGHGYDDNVGAPAFRNVIINGGMSVAQRNTSVASITADGYYTVDRFSTRNITLGTWTQSVENDAPTGSGHRKSLKMLCTAAKASPSAGDGLWIRHKIEGQNLQHFAKGTSSAKSFSLQFWVKSNVTGTYTIALYDNDNNRHIGASYTISASATWEKKTVVFAADTSGAFDNDNLDSLWIDFGLGAGSSWTSGSIPSSWGSYSGTNYAVGQTNLAAATSNYWQITGIQLEAGSVATPFEFEPFETTLRKCQRYYYRLTGATHVFTRFGIGFAYSSTAAAIAITHPVPMRGAQTVLESSLLAIYGGSSVIGATASAFDSTGIYMCTLTIASSSMTAGNAYHLLSNNSTAAFLGIGAEL